MFRIRQYTDFSSPDFNLSSTLHANLAIMSQTSTERNSTMPLPAFFVSRWLLAEQPAISDAVLCFFQPSSVEIALNAVKFPFALCWSKQNTTPHWWHPRPMYTDIWAPCSMSQPSTERNSALPLYRYTSFFCRSLVAYRAAGNSGAVVAFVCLLQWNWRNFLWFVVHVGASKTTHVTGWHPRPMYTDTWAPRSTSQPSTEGNRTMSWPTKTGQHGGENVPTNFWFRIWPGG